MENYSPAFFEKKLLSYTAQSSFAPSFCFKIGGGGWEKSGRIPIGKWWIWGNGRGANFFKIVGGGKHIICGKEGGGGQIMLFTFKDDGIGKAAVPIAPSGLSIFGDLKSQ